MAITNSDGSIILTTRIEDAGLKKGMAKIISDQKTQLQSLTREYAKLITNNKQNTEEAKKLKDQIDKLSKSIKENEGVLRSFEKKSTGAFSRVGSALKSIAGYLAIAFSVTKIIQFSNEAGQLATQTEASVQRLVDIYGSASDSVGDFIDANARALGMSKAAAAYFSSVYGNLFSVWADQATNAELTNRYLNMTAVVASKTGRTVEDVQERVRSGLLGNTEAIEDLGVFVNVKTIEMTDAFQRMANGKSWEQLDAYTQQQIRSMAILEQATAKYGDEVADTSATIRNRFNAAYQDFQNSWGNIVNMVLLPVLETLTQIFDIATKGLNVISGRSGQILENAQIQEEQANKTAKNIEEQVEAQKDLNKETKKTLAGFDDIQVLSSQTTENTGGDGGAKHVDLGLGGTIDGSAYEQEISSTLTAIMAVVGVSLMALGCILLFTGNVLWGLGFIIAGAATFGVTAATLGDDTITQETKDALSNALIIAGVVAILIGILLCMASQWGIGLGLIVIGVASIVTPIALNWDGIKQQLQSSLGGWLVLGGVIAIILGILLCFTPMLPLGIGLIVLGAGAVVAPIVANWDAISSKITEVFNKVIDWIKSNAMLIIGIILTLVGMIPLGIALIVESVRAKKSGEEPSWDLLVEKVKEVWGKIKAFWNKNIAPIFTAEWWINLGKTCINGLIAGFEGGINGIIGAFESMINWIVDGLNKISFDIPDWLGGGSFGINLPRANFGRVKIPRLAQGAVIPPNREFLAVLGDQKQGTNIEAPLQTIVDAFNIALSQNGAGQTTREEHYYLNETELMSIMYKLVKGGERLSGENLISGGVY